MIFHTEIEQLRRLPIPVDPWRRDQVGDINDGPYKAQYPLLPVSESQPGVVVDVSSFGLVSSDFYLDQLMSGDDYLAVGLDERLFWTRALMRESHAKRLAKADSFLRARGLFLFVASGWRHPEVQQLVRKNYAVKHGEDAANCMFAPMQTGSSPPPHATGAAADLEVWSLETGKKLEMYYVLNGRQIYSSYRLEKLVVDTPSLLEDTQLRESLMNRRILYHVLCSLGVVFNNEADLFCNHPGEFWHFGDGDPLSAYLSRQKAARYGLALPPPKEPFKSSVPP